ncbi:hypothetical protein V7O62_09940 [Methanolobus sp. ZRKC2]|uniref:hypothetical protein n=1 Tax=Methanolobus sp. ZRKC2 TaxID=3125783 RepID=UPI003250A907
MQFKSFIDSEFGDNDSFVAAWELFKVDVSSRKMLLAAIEDDMDLKINGSSDGINSISVASDISMESLGLVDEDDRIVNIYEAHYTFEDPVTSLGEMMWFLGEPDTPVTIRFPENIKVTSTEGIDNATIDPGNPVSIVSGKFGSTGEAVVYFEMDELQFADEGELEMASAFPADSDEQSFSSLVDEIFPGFTEEFLENLKGSSLI